MRGDPTTGAASRKWRVVAALLAVVLIAASCGDDGTTSENDGTTAPEPETTTPDTETTTPDDETTVPEDPPEVDDVDPEGVLRLGTDLTALGGIVFDPIAVSSPTAASVWVHFMLYDTLLRENEDNSYSPGLALSAEIVDPQTIDIVLREGVTFQDGEPLTAEAVKMSIQRAIDSNNGTGLRMNELSLIDEISVTGDLTLTIGFVGSSAGSFYNLLAHQETMPVSPKAIADGVDLTTTPVGAGPFQLVELVPESSLTLTKWDGYHDADSIRLAGIEYAQIADSAATVNALRTNAIDMAGARNELLQQVEGTGLETRSELDEDKVFWVFLRCMDEGSPLQDVRVRQALNYATDRDVINQIIYGGRGAPMSQYFAPGSDFHVDALDDVYARDVEKAKELLADAGHADLTLRITTPAQGGFLTTASELLQQQWAEAGITLELVPSQNAIVDFFLQGNTHLFIQEQARVWTDRVTRTFLPPSLGATCQVTDEDFLAAVDELRGLPTDDPRAVELWTDIQTTLSEGAYGGFLVHGTTDNIWNPDRVGNPSWFRDQVGFSVPNFFDIYIKK